MRYSGRLVIRAGTPEPLFGIYPVDYPTACAIGTAQGEENARMFSAAPDMIAALQLALLWLPTDKDSHHARVTVQAALAKALGT
jgi:hypothetical protein